jgi:hypothetical protein
MESVEDSGRPEPFRGQGPADPGGGCFLMVDGSNRSKRDAHAAVVVVCDDLLVIHPSSNCSRKEVSSDKFFKPQLLILGFLAAKAAPARSSRQIVSPHQKMYLSTFRPSCLSKKGQPSFNIGHHLFNPPGDLHRDPWRS